MRVLSQKAAGARIDIFFTAELEALRSFCAASSRCCSRRWRTPSDRGGIAVYLASAEPNGDRRNGFRHGLAALGYRRRRGRAAWRFSIDRFSCAACSRRSSAPRSRWRGRARRQRRLLLLHRISISGGDGGLPGASFYMATRYRADVSWLTRLHDRVVIMEVLN